MELQILQVTAIKEALGFYPNGSYQKTLLSKGSDMPFSSICRVNISLINILKLWISSCPEIGSGTSS